MGNLLDDGKFCAWMKLPIARFLNHICHDVNVINIPIQIKTSAMHLDHLCCRSIGILMTNLICCKLKKNMNSFIVILIIWLYGCKYIKRSQWDYKMSMNIFLILFGFLYEVKFECNIL